MDIDERKSIDCGICGKSYSLICVSLSQGEARKVRAGTGLSWYCEKCQGLGSTIQDLKGCILSLQHEVATLRATVGQLAAPAACGDLSPQAMESIIHEVEERRRREANVMVFNLPELSDPSVETCKRHDRSRIDALVSSLGCSDPGTSVVRFLRIGRRDEARSDMIRPLKVVMSSANVVRSTISETHKLKDNPEWGAIRVSSDKTSRQLENYRHVKDLAGHVAAGKANLKIIYKNGFPTTVSRAAGNG